MRQVPKISAGNGHCAMGLHCDLGRDAAQDQPLDPALVARAHDNVVISVLVGIGDNGRPGFARDKFHRADV